MRRVARPMLYLGIVAAVLGLSKVHAAWVADPPYDYTGSFRFAWSIAYMALLALTAYGVGLPDLPRDPRRAFTSSVAAAATAAAAMSVVQLLAGDALLPRFVVFSVALVLVPWYMLCVAVASGARSRAASADRVVVVAGDAEAALLVRDMEIAPERPATVVETLGAAAATVQGGHHHPLLQVVRECDATVVVLDLRAQGDEQVVGQAAELHEGGVRVRTLSLFYEEWLGKLPVTELERVSLMFDIGEVHRARYGRVRRILDVGMALVAGVFLLLAIPIVWLIDLGFNRGPLFYRQARVGKNGRVFQILKFRTMRPVGGELANEWTRQDDPRITSFGRVLRAVHVDELPQVVNILRGELSVVGPRPEQPHYVEELTEKLPFYGMRHLVRPGLTGWAQVKYGYAGDETDALEKLQYEFYYLRHQGLGLDVRIIGRTVRSVFGGEGR